MTKAGNAVSTEFAAYYNMWVDRFASGSLPDSLSIHYGYVADPTQPFDIQEAQMATNDVVADALGLSPQGEHTIADLGCGVGGPARHMSQRFPNASILAVNIHEPQLRFMQALQPPLSEHVTPVLGDFTDLKFEDNSLDGAYAIESSCYAEDKLAFYQGALRTLRAGARLVICDAFAGRSPETAEEQRLYEQTMGGWVVPNWHPPGADIVVPGATTEYRDLTPHMMPTVTASREATRAFENSSDPVQRDTARAIAAAHACLASGLVQYGLLTVTKRPQTKT
jgi:cyclopropane fatty-acyl-phospholipid synthase-like methyltransferase